MISMFSCPSTLCVVHQGPPLYTAALLAFGLTVVLEHSMKVLSVLFLPLLTARIRIAAPA
jgi:hypothetical protein